MNKYDIYMADVPYRETNDHKLRPVIILNDSAFLVSALPVTSKGKSSDFQYRIIHWEAAGLSVPSYIILQPYRFTDKSMIMERIGRLQPDDIFRLEMRLL